MAKVTLKLNDEVSLPANMKLKINPIQRGAGVSYIVVNEVEEQIAELQAKIDALRGNNG